MSETARCALSHSFIFRSKVFSKRAKNAGAEEHLSVWEMGNVFLERGERKVPSARNCNKNTQKPVKIRFKDIIYCLSHPPKEKEIKKRKKVLNTGEPDIDSLVD